MKTGIEIELYLGKMCVSYSGLAQSVEHVAVNHGVGGSSPSTGAIVVSVGF